MTTPARSTSSSSVALGLLTTHGQALAVANSTVAADLLQTPDVDGDLPLQVAFDAEFALDGLSKLGDFRLRQITDTSVQADVVFCQDVAAAGEPDPENGK